MVNNSFFACTFEEIAKTSTGMSLNTRDLINQALSGWEEDLIMIEL